MANVFPKLEGLIRLSSATVVGTFGGASVSLAAGEYYLNSGVSGGATFLDALETAVTTAIGSGTSTFTLDDDSDTSVGKVTLARTSAFTVTWTSTVIRNLLGFTGNLGSASSHLSTNHAQYLFLPNCGRSNVMSAQSTSLSVFGAMESDYSFTMSPSGSSKRLAYTARYKDTCEFKTLKGSKTWIVNEATTNESLQKFYTDVIGMALPVRYYRLRDDDSTYNEWVIENAGEFAPTPTRPDWTDSAYALWGVRYGVRKRVGV